MGRMKNLNSIKINDKPYVEGKIVVIKQFILKKERDGFKKELKLLKKIKLLELKNNGGFPLVVSAKISNTMGELLMSYVGGDLFEEYNI
jgi:hypothetical protein